MPLWIKKYAISSIYNQLKSICYPTFSENKSCLVLTVWNDTNVKEKECLLHFCDLWPFGGYLKVWLSNEISATYSERPKTFSLRMFNFCLKEIFYIKQNLLIFSRADYKIQEMYLNQIHNQMHLKVHENKNEFCLILKR